jgi:hypothetical protein
MTPDQRNYVFVQSAIGSAIINALINGLIGWGMTRGLTEFPVWKIPGAAVDLVGTAFGVAFGTCLGAVIQIRLDLARGRIAPPLLSGGLSTWIARSPHATLPRALAFGALAAVLFGPFTLGGLLAAGTAAFDRVPFVALKAGFSAVVGAVLTPFILLATLANAPGQNRQGS